MSGGVAGGPVREGVPWGVRLLLIAVGLGLVLMHHLAGAHQHTPSEPVPAVSSAHGTAALHVHHDDGGHDPAGTVHDCLAVLVAAVALAVASWLVAGRTRPRDPERTTALPPGRSPRPPPRVPDVLARLQVLRL